MIKKILSAVIICVLLISSVLVLASCTKEVTTKKVTTKKVTIKEWLDNEGACGDDFTVTVKVVTLINPYYALVNDSTGSVLLFGLWEDGKPKAFAEKDIAEGDTIVVHNPVYNVYEDNVEMIQGTLVKKK